MGGGWRARAVLSSPGGGPVPVARTDAGPPTIGRPCPPDDVPARDLVPPAPILTTRAINRATLARQLLLERTSMSLTAVIEHLVGLQAQTPTPPTSACGRGSRASARTSSRSSCSIARSCASRSCAPRSSWSPPATPGRSGRSSRSVHDRMFQGQFGRRLEGWIEPTVLEAGRAFLEVEPRTFKALGRAPRRTLAGPRPSGARDARPDRRAARPGAAARPVGAERAGRSTPRSRPGSANRPAIG